MAEINPWDYWYPRKEGTIEPEVPKLIDLLKSNNFSRILDLGCGMGRHVLHFARASFEVYGIDISPNAIAKTQHAIQDEHLQANLQVWDMRKSLPFQGDFFDAVISTRVINHNYIDDIRKLVTEINRILRKTGFLFLQVGSYSKNYRKKQKKMNVDCLEPEPRTFIILSGEEKGIPHHTFTTKELRELFPNYHFEQIHSNSEHYPGFCLLLRKN